LPFAFFQQGRSSAKTVKLMVADYSVPQEDSKESAQVLMPLEEKLW